MNEIKNGNDYKMAAYISHIELGIKEFVKQYLDGVIKEERLDAIEEYKNKIKEELNKNCGFIGESK